MDTLLAAIGFLGLGALLIAAFVFASAARRYMAGPTQQDEVVDLPSHRRARIERLGDRRCNTEPVVFPLIIDGEVIREDRRRGERRRPVML